jgi:aminopeptidase
MDEDLLERYADLIVGTGANVQPDQVVSVEAAPEAAPLVHAIARAAYERGAKYVDVLYWDPQIKRIRAEHAAAETLTYVPPWLPQRLFGLAELDAARISLSPVIPPGTLEGVDPERAGADRLPSLRESMKVINLRATSWTISPYPSAAWARVVHPDLPEADAVARLWEEIVYVCRLDEPDPAAAWSRRFEELYRAGTTLDSLDLDALHFEGPGTDLEVGLLPTSRFSREGARSRTRTGVEHAPNLPTEEVFTTPDPERTAGVVRATKPLDVGGAVVDGLRIRFEAGRAVEIDADENVEVIRSRAALDEGAARLGEVALVDRESRIGKLGTTFFSTLLDENAASHIAIGSAYASAVGEDDVARINQSSIHIDFMIGSSDVDVTGMTRAGERVPVLRGGAWQI